MCWNNVAAAEGGIAALVTSAGSAAINYALQTLTRVGDNIVSTPQLYGGTYTLFAHMLPSFGVRCVSRVMIRPEAIAELIDDKPKPCIAKVSATQPVTLSTWKAWPVSHTPRRTTGGR